jgi:hypothetical protein
MKTHLFFILYLPFSILYPLTSCSHHPHTSPGAITLSKEVLQDKIAGGWAGKMIGVTYGAPTEFHALGKTFDDSISWKPEDIRGSMWQDDIYVQLTFMMTMDRYGMDAPAKKFQEMFATAGYMLWHANVQARKNFYDSIFPPESGSPEFNTHADDIDFQIESDYLGMICPGMPKTAMEMADKIGHIMNYGDGVYGGVFIAALYSQAFIHSDIPTIVNEALKSIPGKSDYREMISDVIMLHERFPKNWRTSWQELQNKWGKDHFCEAGSDFNIDAKLNGAFIVMGLLYGEGDPVKTMEISTRCGQDSDCNPSSAMGVLGVVIGYDRLPKEMKEGVEKMGDSLFIHTDYSFHKAVKQTLSYAEQTIQKEGGKEAGQGSWTIQTQTPVASPLEISFPNTVMDKKQSVFGNSSWRFFGNWKPLQKKGWPKDRLFDQSIYSNYVGDSATLLFYGSGISIQGNWCKDGGKADIYLDGKRMRSVDTYFFYNQQEHDNITLWHITGLPEGWHRIKVMVKGERRQDSMGANIYLTNAITYRTHPKPSTGYLYSFLTE